MKKGAGFCLTPECEDFSKGVFLIGNYASSHFRCPRCQGPAHVELDRGEHLNDEPVFKEVRVNYNFDSVNGTYRNIAIVQDINVAPPFNVYAVTSPLIKTERRAILVAETILGNIQWKGPVPYEETRTAEIVLCFDDPIERLREGLALLEDRITKRAERENYWRTR